MFLSLIDLLRHAGRLFDPVGEGVPAPEILDEGDHLLLTVPLQGYDPHSIQIQVTDTALAIAGQSAAEEQTEAQSFFRMQSFRSDFYRTLSLPVRVDPTRSTAEWQTDGTLVIRLPKR